MTGSGSVPKGLAGRLGLGAPPPLGRLRAFAAIGW